MIAADIHQTACLDKCNRIVSNFIASPSFRCIYVMTRTLNPAVMHKDYDLLPGLMRETDTREEEGAKAAA